jgi:hypothetical protein
MAKHLIYFRDIDGDHLVDIEVEDELWDDAMAEMDSVDVGVMLELGLAGIAHAAQRGEIGRRIG